MRLILLFTLALISFDILGQNNVGIGTTSPDNTAILDVSANDKGILIPRVDSTARNGIVSPATGLLIFNSDINRFEYYNGSEWKGIESSEAYDWYELGTTTAPDSIDNPIYRNGSVLVELELNSTDLQYSSKNSITDFGSGITYGAWNHISAGSTGEKYGTYNQINSSAINEIYGTYNLVNNSNAIQKFGTKNQVNGAGTGISFGTQNVVIADGTGSIRGTENNVIGNGNSIISGTSNWLTNSGDGEHRGVFNTLSGTGAGHHFGIKNLINGPSDGDMYGMETIITGTSLSNTTYGMLNTLNSQNEQIGISNEIVGANGLQYGIRNSINGASDGDIYGLETTISGTSSSNTTYGMFNTLNSQNAQIGIRNEIVGVNGIQYGIQQDLTSSGSSFLYGNFNFITQYGTGSSIGSGYTFNGSSDGNHTGRNLHIGVTGNGELLGIHQTIDNDGNGDHKMIENEMEGTGNGVKIGVDNIMENDGSGPTYGTRNELSAMGTGEQYGVYSLVNNSGNGTHYGSYTSVDGNGSGMHFGTYNSLLGSGSGDHTGTRNEVSTTGPGYHRGTLNFLGGNGTGTQIGSEQFIENSGNADHWGTLNSLNGSGSGSHVGSYNFLSGAGTGQQTGSRQFVGNSNDNIHYGSLNQLSGTGSGDHFGVKALLSGTGTGFQTGMFSEITNTSASEQIGFRAVLNNAGTGIQYGLKSEMSGSGNGDRTGSLNSIITTGAGIYKGTHNELTGGTGTSYGIQNIVDAISGTQYGTYNSIVENPSATNIAGYFDAPGTSNNFAAVFYHGNVRVNEAGGDYDLHVSTDNEAHTLFVEGATDRIGLGTNAPAVQVHMITDDVSGRIFQIENENTGTNADGLQIKLGPNSNPTSANAFIAFRDNGNNVVGSITGDAAGGVNYNTTSDVRLKQNIKPLNNALDIIQKVEVKKYERKLNPGIEEIGYIAQQLYEVYPAIVSGTPDNSIEEPMSVDYGKITPLLVAAIQEQQALIKELQKEIKAMKTGSK